MAQALSARPAASRRWSAGALAAAAFLLWGGAAPAAPAAAEPEWRQARLEMRKACAARAWDACQGALLRLLAATSGNADLVYNLGAVEALRGDREAALTWLRRYAALGLGHDAGADEDFKGLAGDPRFAAVLQALERNRAPLGAPVEVARLPANDLLAEDVARDPAAGAWYVSSIRARRVLLLPDAGPARTLLAEGPGLWGMMALGLDAPRRLLWATTAALPQAQGLAPGDAGRTALLKLSLPSGKLEQRIELGSPGERHALGDLTVGPDGTVFASDGLGGAVYRLQPGADALEELAGRSELQSPQTPALAPDGRTLYVPDWLRGIAAVDVRTRAVRWLEHGEELTLNGIDGLYLRSPRELVAVQNGVEPPRVVRLRLDARGRRVTALEVLARGAPLGDPTHGAIDGASFVVLAFSGWGSFGEDGSVKPGEPKEPPRLLRLPLGPAYK